MEGRSVRHFSILAALLAGLLAYGVAAPAIGWVSDDYSLVYGGPLQSWPRVADAFLAGGEGHFSVHRLLCYPLIGYVGGVLGPAAAHVLQVLLHLLCGWLFYALLRRLRWPAVDAAWATATFLVVPWVSQPVYWWSSVCTVVSTIFIMIAAHAYVAWSRKEGPWLWACLICIFVALLFYELWLGSFVLFFGLEFYLRSIDRQLQPSSWSRRAGDALRRSWPALIPYAVWMILFLALHRPEAHQPTFSLVRVPIVFLSIHLRAIHWLLDTPWRSALVDGFRVLASLTGGVLLVALAVICCADRSARAKTSESALELAPALWLAWSVFLAARLVFILQGGVATHTRHSYGAAMGVAIAFAALLRWAQNRWPAARVCRILSLCAGGALAVCTVASAGIGVHYRETSAAEEKTCRQLIPKLPSLPGGSTIVVAGDPTGTRGELAYFSEEDGAWLERILRAQRPDISAVVATDVKAAGDYLVIMTAARATSRTVPLQIERNHTVLFRWREHQLEPMELESLPAAAQAP